MKDDKLYNTLKWIALAGGILWFGYELYGHFAQREPGDIAYLSGNNFFKDGYYERAEEAYLEALKEEPNHAPSLRALANTYIQLKNYDKALAVINASIKNNPEFGGHYATRGIIYDHIGKYELAIADYEKSLKLYPEVADGMHWLDRLLYNVHDAPPTVKDRLGYLKKQMTLPAEERVLRLPEVDNQQMPYEQ